MRESSVQTGNCFSGAFLSFLEVCITYGEFFDEVSDEVFDEVFDECFLMNILTNVFDEFFTIFLTNFRIFSDEFFDLQLKLYI